MSHHLQPIHKIKPDLIPPRRSPSPPPPSPPPCSRKPSSSGPILRPAKGNSSDALAPSSHCPRPSPLSSSALHDVPSTMGTSVKVTTSPPRPLSAALSTPSSSSSLKTARLECFSFN
ncbi:hypothetical protein HMI56_007014 [Coelomomyces lativittatus]|nr:hypothetical protein HMI56_007014 [Coelomomyces lativittatus]